jgi:hypothetical protein
LNEQNNNQTNKNDYSHGGKHALDSKKIDERTAQQIPHRKTYAEQDRAEKTLSGGIQTAWGVRSCVIDPG